MDTTTLITFGIGILVIAVFFGAMLGIQFYMAKGKNPGKVIDTADAIIDTAKAANDSVGKLLIPAPAEAIIDKVLTVAQSGVHEAEQLYQSGQLPPDLRKEQAVQSALNLLKLEGREITPEIEAAIRGAAEDAVFVMSLKQKELGASVPKGVDSAPTSAPADPSQPTA